MNKVSQRILVALFLVLPVTLYGADVSTQVTQPNILIILADDMGYSDLGCYGSEIQTPNLDRLARGGMKFSQMYNTAKCYPTRACLQTGVLIATLE